MLQLALLTVTLAVSQTLKIEISNTIEEYLSQMATRPDEYYVVLSDQAPRGAMVLYQREPSGRDSAIFFFNTRLFQRLSETERRVLISHEVGHLAPECQPLRTRLYRELCADRVSLRFVPRRDVSAMLIKSMRMFSYYPARQEFMFRLAMIQEARAVEQEGKAAVAQSSGVSPDYWPDCA